MGISNPPGSITCNSIAGTISDIPGSITNNGEGPEATNVAFTGTLEVGETLTGSYDYSGPLPESGSTYQWYRADDDEGLNAAPISGATSITYEQVEDDDTKFLAFGVTPSDGVQTGTEVISDYQGPVTAAFRILLETGDAILTEEDDFILLEDAA